MEEEILIIISVCVILPVAIVWIVSRTRQNETNKRAEIALKAIENGQSVNPDIFKAPREGKTIKEKLLGNVTGGCVGSIIGAAFAITGALVDDTVLILIGAVFMAVGIACFVTYFVGKKMLEREMEAEVKLLEHEAEERQQ